MAAWEVTCGKSHHERMPDDFLLAIQVRVRVRVRVTPSLTLTLTLTLILTLTLTLLAIQRALVSDDFAVACHASAGEG